MVLITLNVVKANEGELFIVCKNGLTGLQFLLFGLLHCFNYFSLSKRYCFFCYLPLHDINLTYLTILGSFIERYIYGVFIFYFF